MSKIITNAPKNPRLCFMDMETLNLALHECHNLPWQIAMIIMEGNRIVDKFNFLVKWPFPVECSKGAAEKNHYDADEIAKNGLPPEEVFEAFDRELNKADYICGHNLVSSDAYWSQCFYRMNKEKPFNIYPKMLDTHCILKGIKLEQLPKPNEDPTAWQIRMYHTRKKGLKTQLELMGKEFNIEHDYSKLHDALCDLELNVKVFDQIRYQIL